MIESALFQLNLTNILQMFKFCCIIDLRIKFKNRKYMFYSNLAYQLNFQVLTFPLSTASTSSIVLNISYALEKSVTAYSYTLQRPSASSNLQQSVIKTLKNTKKTVECINSPVKSKSTQKNFVNTMSQVKKSMKKSSKTELIHSNSQMQLTIQQERYDDSKNIANIPEFQPYLLEKNHKIVSLLSRKVDAWPIDKPRRKVIHHVYNLLQ